MKKLSKIFIVIFMLISLLPSLGMLIFGASGPAANEILTPKPKLTGSDGEFNTEYLNQLSDYFADRFAFRQEYISLWSALNAKLLNTSVEEQVLIGKGPWLFYSSTLDDYTGKTLSQREIYYAARNIFLMQEYARSTGAEFVFTLAPNKNSLYPEFMQQGYDRAGKNNAALLELALSEQGVNYADLFSAFDRPEILYYSQDSHWNDKGAALAADVLNDSLGRNSDYFSADFAEGTGHRGDLYEMLYPAGKHLEANPVYSGVLSYSCAADPNGGNAITIDTSGAGEGNLLCYRDSFGISLYPYLADSFETARFSRAGSYDLCALSELGCSDVIIEIVERNIPQLAVKAPAFPAPARDMIVYSLGDMPFEAKLSGSKNADGRQLVCFSAVIAESSMDAESCAYVLSDKGAFEACITAAGDGNVSLTAWIDEGSEIQGIIIKSEGEYILHPGPINKD